MGRFFIFFITLCTFFSLLNALTDESQPAPLNLRSRTLLQNPNTIGAEAPGKEIGSSDEKSEETTSSEAPVQSRKIGEHHSDKSVAGGGVIIGGLVTAIFAAVYCYIRVTRKRHSDNLKG